MNDLNRQELKQISPGIVFSEPMSRHTTFRIGGNADAFVEVSSPDEIFQLTTYCRKNNIPVMIMGNGSNMLVSDKGIEGLVIAVHTKMNSITVSSTTITAQAGALLSAVAAAAAEAGLTGLEFASGIPGTVGGGIFMNAGAYGGELVQVIDTVTYADFDGNIYTKPAEELDMSYRHSMFSDGGYIILECSMCLTNGSAEDIRALMLDYKKRRTEKQPLSEPSAGSTFKRPPGYFAGKLIQDCGLMGFKIGGAAVSEKHAGFVVNKGGATADDVMRLIRHVQHSVKEKFGVELEPEIRITGRQ